MDCLKFSLAIMPHRALQRFYLKDYLEVLESSLCQAVPHTACVTDAVQGTRG